MIRNTGVCLADIFKWLCHRTMLTALRGAYRFTPAQAAIFIAAEAARVPHGPKASCIRGRLACAFVRLRRPTAPLRVTFDRTSPPSCRITMRREVVAPWRANARASGGQGWYQHYSTTAPLIKVFEGEGGGGGETFFRKFPLPRLFSSPGAGL